MAAPTATTAGRVATTAVEDLRVGAMEPTPPPSGFRGSVEEWEVRVDLAACYRLVALHGWDDLVGTHLSARVPGTDDAFLINDFGLSFDEMTASSLVKVDLEGNVLDDDRNVNPAGFTIHSAVYAVRADAGSVLHLHTLDGMAVSAVGPGLLPLNQIAMLVTGDLAYHDYEGVALDLAERAHIQEHLGDRNLMLMRHHGTLAVGDCVATAFVRMFQLERACAAQVRTLGMGLDLAPLDDDARRATEAMSGLAGYARIAWPAMRRRLDRVDPGYRT